MYYTYMWSILIGKGRGLTCTWPLPSSFPEDIQARMTQEALWPMGWRWCTGKICSAWTWVLGAGSEGTGSSGLPSVLSGLQTALLSLCQILGLVVVVEVEEWGPQPVLPCQGLRDGKQ